MTKGAGRWTEGLGHVRPGQQTRSQRTQVAVVDAAAELFAEQGVDATTLAQIAERANSSIGAIYHHFRDKVAIQHAVFDRFVELADPVAHDGVAPDRWTGATVPDLVSGYVRVVAERDVEQRSLKRAALEIARTEPELGARFATLGETVDEGLRRLLLARRDEIGHPHPALAVTTAIQAMAAMLRSRLEFDPSSARFGAHSTEEFVEETVSMVLGYLGTPA